MRRKMYKHYKIKVSVHCCICTKNLFNITMRLFFCFKLCLVTFNTWDVQLWLHSKHGEGNWLSESYVERIGNWWIGNDIDGFSLHLNICLLLGSEEALWKAIFMTWKIQFSETLILLFLIYDTGKKIQVRSIISLI